MVKNSTQLFLIIISLLIITPLGFLSKLYHGFGETWINDYSGDILYEIFWCLFFFLLIPSRKAITQIPLGVFTITCILEVLQLWKPPFLLGFSPLCNRLYCGLVLVTPNLAILYKNTSHLSVLPRKIS